MQTSLMETLQTIFQDVFDDPKLQVDRTSNALSVPGWDSFAHINLITAIEQKFHVRFALGELEQLKNVGEMLDLLERKLQSKQ